MTAEAPPQKGVPLPDESKIGLSEFVARVLNQLSLSAWLPAAFFVVSLAIMLTFRHQGSIDLGVLVTTLRDSSVQWTIVLTAVPGLVIATLITQAFSFEAIRALEGYWRRGGLIAHMRTRMIKRELARKNVTAQRRVEVGHQAFLASRGRWVDLEEDPAVIDAMEAISRGKYPRMASPAVVKKAKALNWKSLCDPWLIAEVNHLREAHREFPVDSRILPTRLGNLIRAEEDKLTHAGDDLSGFALRRRSLASPEVQQQHDQFRTRLDMYCTLVFCAITLALVSPLILAGATREPDVWHWLTIGAVVAGFLTLSRASYLAAVASARGYVSALRQMDLAPERKTSEP